ncbi:hypothetical protein [Couchioplanes azureus]|uniref:hypothetical protein n=1 Tax=Couchioplanes caeruleus TaxID=56438 RepID=UPI0016706423|nr:hypothetical protein [Couchioplanes caeruleus]GGQ39208.1 hypothetical protein GCM10010166_02400 [Couchioplanes caeruleus subsp. azureus]
MSGLSDAERDAGEIVRLLAGLAARLQAGEQDRGTEQEMLAALAEDGGAAAARVLAYLRTLRGAGDGAATTVPPRLGPWRHWVPSRGNLFGGPVARSPRVLGGPAAPPRIEELPRPRRRDPGE